MDHRFKTKIFQFLELLPRSIGMKLYHTIQGIYNKHTVEESLRDHLSTLKRFELGLNKHHLSFANLLIAEIGSGWLPATPYLLLSEFNARGILTYDIENHYQKSKIKELNDIFSHKDSNKFQGGSDNLHSAVTYFPVTDIVKGPPSESVDAIITRNVLEHVKPEDIVSIHTSAHGYLSDDGFIVHQISPSDHRAYYDRNLSLWDFLKYSREEWDQIQTSFDYHNRLRLPHYLKMFEDSGYVVLHCDYNAKKDRIYLPAQIHPEFSDLTTEELTAGNIFVILRKKHQ